MSDSLLAGLVSGREETRLLLLQDSAKQTGRLLLKCIVVQWAQKYGSLHLLLTETHPQDWLHGVPQTVRDRLKVHDLFSDPLGWNNTSSDAPLLNISPSSFCKLIDPSVTTTTDSSSTTNTGDHPSRAKSPATMETDSTPHPAIVLDSLSSLLLRCPPARVCRLLYCLSAQGSPVTSLCHADLLDPCTRQTLEHVASSLVTAEPPNADLASEYHAKCRITHQRKSGKVIRKTEWCSVGEDFSISTEEQRGTAEQPVAAAAPDPTADLTFRLSLSERERRERAKVVLPYTYSEEKKSAHLQAGAGRVFYQPDEADDFDESDPDDDLDF